MNNIAVVQLWGMGNLINTIPLMRSLRDVKQKTLFLNPARTGFMSFLFPDWNVRYKLEGEFDVVFVCYPCGIQNLKGLESSDIRFPHWASTEEWIAPEHVVLKSMWVSSLHFTEEVEPTLKLEKFFGAAPEDDPTRVAVSWGWNKQEAGWEFKDWGVRNWWVALEALEKKGAKVYVVGDGADHERLRHFPRMFENLSDLTSLPFKEQLKTLYLGGVRKYLGHDTGWGHIMGALKAKSAIYTAPGVDITKVRTASPCQWQFEQGVEPERAVEWLVEESHGDSEQGQGEEDTGGREDRGEASDEKAEGSLRSDSRWWDSSTDQIEVPEEA